MPLSNTFFIVWLQNSHNDTFHKLMKSELIGCPRPYNWSRRGRGRNFTCVRYTVMCRPNGWILHKKVPLSNTFFIVWLQNSHNDTFHKLMKSELIGCPYNWSRRGRGRNFTCVRYTVMYRPNGWILHNKICKDGSHFDPPKKNPKHGSNLSKIG